MTETTTILATLLALGGGVITYLLAKNEKLENKINQLTNIVMRAVVAMQEPHDAKRNRIADDIIQELTSMVPRDKV